jgi:hypothetical protein
MWLYFGLLLFLLAVFLSKDKLLVESIFTLMPAFWLHCATVWKVVGSIPDGVIWIFH